MTLGKAICNVHQLFIGSLRKYGYDKFIYDVDGDLGLPKDFEVKSQEVLDDELVAALLLQGSLTHDADGSLAKSNKVDELKEQLQTEDVEEEKSDKTTQEEIDQHAVENPDQEKVDVPQEEQTGEPQPEGQTFEDHITDELQLASSAGGQPPAPEGEHQAPEGQSEFDRINELSWQAGKAEVAKLEDVDLLTKLSEEAEKASVKQAAADRLEELTNPGTEQ